MKDRSMVESPGPTAPVKSEIVSPPTARVVQIIEFLARHQGERFTLSEIARGCDITKPTCLGIAAELTARGFLVRDPRTKSYGLGPGLVVVGRAAQREFALGPSVRGHLEVLCDQFHAVCTAAAVVGD